MSTVETIFHRRALPRHRSCAAEDGPLDGAMNNAWVAFFRRDVVRIKEFRLYEWFVGFCMRNVWFDMNF